MGLAHRSAVAAGLIEGPAETAAPVVFAASTPRARTWVGTLGDLGTAPGATDADEPGTIVIGDVVDLQAVLAMCPVDVSRVAAES